MIDLLVKRELLMQEYVTLILKNNLSSEELERKSKLKRDLIAISLKI